MVVEGDLDRLTGLVLGFDGSAGSSKALRSARHLVEIVPVPLHAVWVGEEAPEPDPLEEVVRYFDDMPGVDLHLHHLRGEPREALLLAAQRLDCNMIAVGYRGRSRVKDLFLGRVTEWLLRQAEVSLLVSR